MRSTSKTRSGSVRFASQKQKITGAAGIALGGQLSENPTYQINLRGQDKRHTEVLGANPNANNIEDEYIHNLQQQMHFMDLELRILKEKVAEDEKQSGIGSLFNDEKNKSEHVSELKTKYHQMRIEYEKRLEDMDQRKLKVLGDQFVLDAQINVLSEINKERLHKFQDFSNNKRKALEGLQNESEDKMLEVNAK